MSSLKEGTHEMEGTGEKMTMSAIMIKDEYDDDDVKGNMRYSARCLVGFKVRTEQAACQCVASSTLSSSSPIVSLPSSS